MKMQRHTLTKDEIYEELRKFGTNVELIRMTNPTVEQLEDFRNGLVKLAGAQRMRTLRNVLVILALVPTVSFGIIMSVSYHDQRAVNSNIIAQSVDEFSKIASIYNLSHIQCAIESGSCN